MVDPSVQGALIALGGVALTLLATELREHRRQHADLVREAARERHEAHLRTFEHRRAAYVDFAELLLRWRNSLQNREILEGDLPETDFDTFDPVFDSLAVVQFYGTSAGRERASDAAGALVEWLNSDRKSRRAKLNAFEKAREAFVQQVRQDLGVDTASG